MDLKASILFNDSMDIRSRLKEVRGPLFAALLRNVNVVFFLSGFLFDYLTLDRIDAWIDLVLQGLYILGLTVIIMFQTREEEGLWSPSGRIAQAWRFNVEALHFLYGGLLSAYIIFYSKSGAGRSLAFLVVVVVLMVANELTAVQRASRRLRLGLHAFCVASFLNYLLPVLLGRMGDGVFAMALGLTLLFSAGLLFWVWRITRSIGLLRSLACPPAAVLGMMGLFYALRWIPPVPLSMQFGGIFHHVGRKADRFELTYRKPPWYRFWRKDDRAFAARPGDRVYCFVRVFAPTHFTHTINLRWRVWDPEDRNYATSDKIPLEIRGGRGEGYRGFAFKANHRPGRWRVDVETSQGRLIGTIPFRIEADTDEGPRDWKIRKM